MCFTMMGSRSSKLSGLPTKLMRHEHRALQNCAVSFYSLLRLHGCPPSPCGFVDVCITLFRACEVESLRALFSLQRRAGLLSCECSYPQPLPRSLGHSTGCLLWSQDVQHKGGSCERSTFILCLQPGSESAACCAHRMFSTKAGPVSEAPFILCLKPGPESRQPAALAGCCSRKDTPALVSACADAGSPSRSGCICCGQVLWTFML